MASATYPSATADKFVVRLPDGMRERIAEVARENHRSMNSEIINRLEVSILAESSATELPKNLNSPEITHKERELLKHFRQLAHRQQNAVVALITADVEGE